MRRWLIIFMLLLLPIRGLVGDAMAYSMLPANAPATSTAPQNAMYSIANSSLFTWAISLFGHETSVEPAPSMPCHMAMAAGDSDDTAQGQCTTCQVCHLSAATPMQLPDALLHTAAALPQQAARHWHSAEPRQLFKTPVF